MIHLKELNKQQYEAVTDCEHHTLIIAGAGAGKTRVLTYKIAYLIDKKGLLPYEILALTFTNKAAKEMKSRIGKILNDDYLNKNLWCGTFHSIFARILRIDAERIGFTSNFTIYDQSDAKKIVKRIIDDFHLDDKTYKLKFILNRISWAKNNMILPNEYGRNQDALNIDKKHSMPDIYKIYQAYWEICKSSNCMDFDDILLYTYLLLQNESVQQKYSGKFKYLLVDEYQDTNTIQFHILNLLVGNETKLCVVGDDAQSIYKFRGANIKNILSFQDVYPNSHLIKLEQNYRSTQNIVNAANSIIKYNKGKIPKTAYTKNEKGELIHILEAISDKEEAYKVIREIKHLISHKSLKYSDIVILYRTNTQSRPFEDIFHKEMLPYQILGGLSFYQRKEIKDILAYFRLVCNPNDNESLLRIINYPARGIGATSLKKIRDYAQSGHLVLWDVIQDIHNHPIKIGKGILSKIEGFVQLIKDFQANLYSLSAYDLALKIIHDIAIIPDLLKEDSIEGKNKQLNIEELLNAIKDFSTDSYEESGKEITFLYEYLPYVSLLTDEEESNDTKNSIKLMTIHAAKGLEFKAVFITGMETNLFPNSIAIFDESEMEEERRLFYVALTRAKQYCYLSYANSRFKYGQSENTGPSIFLKELDTKYIQWNNCGAQNKHFHLSKKTYDTVRPISVAINREETNMELTSSEKITESKQFGIKIGTIIQHERFGIGTIDFIEGTGNETKATIKFENVGEKKLLMKFAKYKIIKHH